MFAKLHLRIASLFNSSRTAYRYNGCSTPCYAMHGISLLLMNTWLHCEKIQITCRPSEILHPLNAMADPHLNNSSSYTPCLIYWTRVWQPEFFLNATRPQGGWVPTRLPGWKRLCVLLFRCLADFSQHAIVHSRSRSYLSNISGYIFTTIFSYALWAAAFGAGVIPVVERTQTPNAA